MNSIEFYPYPFFIGLALIALWIFLKRGRGWLYGLVSFLFGVYLLAVLNRIAFPIYLPGSDGLFGPIDLFANGLDPRINLIPFNYGSMFKDVAAGILRPSVAFWEIAGNILMTIPFGLGMNLFYLVRARRVLWLALGVGLAFEGIELLILLFTPSYHAVDINDVLLNALGVLFGYGLFRAAERITRSLRTRWSSMREVSGGGIES